MGLRDRAQRAQRGAAPRGGRAPCPAPRRRAGARAGGRGAGPHRGARRPRRAARRRRRGARRARRRPARRGAPARRRGARLRRGRPSPRHLRAGRASARLARAALARRRARRPRPDRGDAVSGARDPDAILAELGRELQRSWRRPPRRSRLAGWRRSVLIAVATLVLVPTALATRDAVWAPAPAPLPDAARPPGAVAPRHVGDQVYVAGGELRGVGWRLSASSCDYASVRAVGVF